MSTWIAAGGDVGCSAALYRSRAQRASDEPTTVRRRPDRGPAFVVNKSEVFTASVEGLKHFVLFLNSDRSRNIFRLLFNLHNDNVAVGLFL